MKRVILAGHGHYPEGILSSLEMIIGKQENISVISAYVNNQNIEASIQETLENYGQDEIIILTDLFGGSVNNLFLKYTQRQHIYLVAGANLALVIEIILKLKQCRNIDKMLKEAVLQAACTIVYCDDVFLEKNDGELSDF